ncbi:MAG: hypothetical protein ABWX56_07515 [Mycetocola sp.]
MKTSTKNLLFGVLAVVVALVIASVIVNLALSFLAVVIKFVLIAGVALALLAVAWVWWAANRSRD